MWCSVVFKKYKNNPSDKVYSVLTQFSSHIIGRGWGPAMNWFIGSSSCSSIKLFSAINCGLWIDTASPTHTVHSGASLNHSWGKQAIHSKQQRKQKLGYWLNGDAFGETIRLQAWKQLYYKGLFMQVGWALPIGDCSLLSILSSHQILFKCREGKGGENILLVTLNLPSVIWNLIV